MHIPQVFDYAVVDVLAVTPSLLLEEDVLVVAQVAAGLVTFLPLQLALPSY